MWLILFSHRCDVNLTDDVGFTPLHYAVLSNSPDIVAALLENGANPAIRDNLKMTPLQYSREKVGDMLYIHTLTLVILLL